jgi:RecA/RadA recombinase
MLVPIRRMYERLEVEKQESDVSGFYSLLYFGELVVKLTTLGFLAGISDDRDRTRYGHMYGLVRSDGIGDWAQCIDALLTGPGAQFIRPGFDTLHRDLAQRVGPDSWQYQAVSLLRDAMEAFGIDLEPLPKTVALRQWPHWFSLMRNKTRGHGAPLAHHCASVVPLLDRSLRLLTDNLCLFSWQWAYLRRNLSGKYRVTAASDSSDSFDSLRRDGRETYADGMYVFNQSILRADLIYSDADLTDLFLPNGNFRDGEFEVISYITNETRRVSGLEFSAPPGQLPPSETEGLPDLDAQGNTIGNVPALGPGYVSRPALEEQLTNALSQSRHEIVTLGGPGGAGKTTLALAVIAQLQAAGSPRFEVVVWFSSRDIDLLPSGPKPVRPHGVSQADFAHEFARLVAPAERTAKGFKAVEFLANSLQTTPLGPTLFVFDNFETVTNPVDQFAWLDAHIRAPNKILITTRSREFVGDYPIELLGMSDEEANALIDLTAKELGISDLLSAEYRRALIDESGGHPYVLKILLGEVAKDRKATKPQRLIAAQDRILQALFERTYSKLSPSAQRVFLLLSSWRSVVPLLAVEAVVLRNASERIDVQAAVDELKRLSLVEVISTSTDAEVFLSVPSTAISFGQKKLNASPMKAVVDADAELIQEFGSIQKSGLKGGVNSRVPTLVRALARRVASGKEDLQAVKPMLEFIADRVPTAWFEIAQLYVEEGHAEGPAAATDAIRRYIESGDTSISLARAWETLATYSRLNGDPQQEVHAIVEMAREPNISSGELSRLADRVNHLFATAKKDGVALFQVEERRLLLNRLTKRLERVLDQLDATDISRLAWLHLQAGDTQRAKDLAGMGLKQDPENTYCAKLYRLLST